jgi:hypothetical protein
MIAKGSSASRVTTRGGGRGVVQLPAFAGN